MPKSTSVIPVAFAILLIATALFASEPLTTIDVNSSIAVDLIDCDGCASDVCGCSCGTWLSNILGGSHRSSYHHHKRHSLADRQPPAGLMGEHVHERGEWMVEYKYMNMYMAGNQIGRQSVANAAAFDVNINGSVTNAQAIPTNMTMEMHMIHIMYGWRDNVTLYIMPMLSSLTMDHLRDTPFGPNNTLNGTPFTTHNSGFDDLVMGALWRVHKTMTSELILNLGFSVPTGNIDRQTTAPFGVAIDLPYPMRRGSGTFDARPGITYKKYCDSGSFGAQYQADLTIGNNDQGYAVGDEHRMNFWYSWLATDRLAFSFRVENLWRKNFDGADVDQTAGTMAFISTNRSDSRGGKWTNFGYGGALTCGDGYLLNFEAVHPVYENLKGIQLSNNWWFAASISRAF